MHWISPANSNIYDHASAFAEFGFIDWLQKANYAAGDTVYLYCTKPYQKIMYKTLVEKANLPHEEIQDDEKFWYDRGKYEEKKDGMFARLRLIEQADTQNLHLSALLMNGLTGVPQRPIRCNGELEEYLRKHFNDFYSEDFFVDMSEDDGYIEGMSKKVLVNKYERSSVARGKCIEYNGCSCSICGINFETVYGEIGKGFIHVHHKVALSEIKENYVIDYKNDLVPVCPNCHAMLHRKLKGRAVSMVELKKTFLLNKQSE